MRNSYVVVRETPFQTSVLFKGTLSQCEDFARFYKGEGEQVFVQELA